MNILGYFLDKDEYFGNFFFGHGIAKEGKG